jgi:small subunit ribosomal protein S27Ae
MNLNMAKDNKAGKGGKKPRKNKPTSKKYSKYKIQGDTIIRQRSCPRCGAGVFLMIADNRQYCGRCHYTEFSKK